MALAKKLTAPTGNPVNVKNNLGGGSRGTFTVDQDEPMKFKPRVHPDELRKHKTPGDKNPWPKSQ